MYELITAGERERERCPGRWKSSRNHGWKGGSSSSKSEKSIVGAGVFDRSYVRSAVKPWPAGQDKRTRRGIGDSGKG